MAFLFEHILNLFIFGFMLQALKLSALFFCLCIAGGCGSSEEEKEMQEKIKDQPAPIDQKNIPEEKTVNDTIKDNIPQKIDTTLFPVARQIVKAFKEKDYASVAAYIHGKKGITFSPYAYIDSNVHQTFTKKAFAQISKTKKYTWGNYDGSGDPIKLNVNDYFNRFVYNMNFLENAQIAQDEFLSSGTRLNNLEEIYPGSSFVEFYIPESSDGKTGWGSLRLVFYFDNNEPKLVAVIHGEWTI